MPFPSAISAAVAAILPHLSHQVRKILLTIFFSIRMGTIFMIEVSFAQMSVIKCISHVLETILGAFHRNRKLIPKGPSHSAFVDFDLYKKVHIDSEKLFAQEFV